MYTSKVARRWVRPKTQLLPSLWENFHWLIKCSLMLVLARPTVAQLGVCLFLVQFKHVLFNRTHKNIRLQIYKGLERKQSLYKSSQCDRLCMFADVCFCVFYKIKHSCSSIIEFIKLVAKKR